MSNSYSEWTIYRYPRQSLALLIVLPTLVLSVFKIGDWDNLFARLDDQFVQEYLIFAGLAFVFSYFLIKNLYRSWLLFYGITTSLIGVSHLLYFIKFWEENTKQGGTDYFYAALLFSPLLALALATLLIWRQQDLNIPVNSRSDRLLAVAGLLISVILMIAEFLPWVRQISRATSDTWKFNGSGTKNLIEECCYVTDFGLNSSLQIYLPLIGLSALFLISSLGYQISNIAFLPSIFWCVQEGLDFLTSLGIQDPLSVWTKKEIEENGLTYRVEGLFGGYLFIAGVISLLILVLVPRVLSGRIPANQNGIS